MNFENLTSENIALYLAKNYDTPNSLISEYQEDIARFNYTKRILKRYRKEDIININLLLNHIIILSNVFGIEPTVRTLFFKLREEDYSIIKTMLLFLNIMPNIVAGIKGKNILSSDISIDMEIVNKLRNIK